MWDSNGSKSGPIPC